jgi:hypothetical protein
LNKRKMCIYVRPEDVARMDTLRLTQGLGYSAIVRVAVVNLCREMGLITEPPSDIK